MTLRASTLRAGVLLLVLASSAAGQGGEPEESAPGSDPVDQRHSAQVDIHWFAQSDAGGNPYQREGVRYLGERSAFSIQVQEAVRLRAAVTVAKLEDGGTDDGALFSTITNAQSTQASKEQTPVTAQLWADVDVSDALRLTPGVYFFHQSDHRSVGGSLDLSLDLTGGDTTPFVGIQLLKDELELDYWDGSDRGDDDRLTISAVVGITQALGPSVITSVSLQYVHQEGFLGDPINVVPIWRGFRPVRIADERLPRRRDRLQLNGRLRYSFLRGWSVGLDVSCYADSWGLQHASLEPSLELAIVPDLCSLRLWVRVARQRGARYFEERRQREERHQTRDSDLGGFVLGGAGGLLSIRLGTWGGVTPEIRASFLYYRRDDLLDGILIGGGMGVQF